MKRRKNPSNKSGVNEQSADGTLNKEAMAVARGFMLGQLIDMAWRLAVMLLLPIFIGVQLDNRLQTKPIFALTLLFMGAITATAYIYKTYAKLNKISDIEHLNNNLNKPRKGRTE